MSPVPKKSRLEKAEKSPMALESNPNSGLIRFEVDKVSTLDEVGQESQEIVVGGVPWRARVCKKKEEGKDFLSINLFGGASKFELWIIDINAELTLLNDNSSKDRTEIVTGTYNRNNYICGSSILVWEELMDEEKGFVKDDKIIIEIRSSISNMKGICIPTTSNKGRPQKPGVSSKVSDNDPNSGVIRFDVDKLWYLDENGRYSPEIEVAGVLWKGQVTRNDFDGDDYLIVNLISVDYASKELSIEVKSEVTLFNSDNNKSITERSSDTFCYGETSCGTYILKWKDLVDEDKGFINDGLITIEIRFSILEMEGIWFQPRFNSYSAGENFSNIVLMTKGKPTLMNKQSLCSHDMVTRNVDANVSNSGFIRFDVNEVSTLDEKGHFSSEVEVGGLPWKANLCKREDHRKHYLCIYLYSINSPSKLWSLDVNAEYTIVNSGLSKDVVKTMYAETFNHEQTSRGCCIIPWNDAINEEKGFIKDDKVIAEIQFSISSMTGIWIKPRFDSSQSGNNCSDIVLMDGSPIVAKKQRDLCPSAKTRSGNHGDNDEKVSGFLSFEISVSDIRHYFTHSPVIDVQGMSWSLSVRKEDRSPFLEAYLKHGESESNIWSFDVSTNLRLVNNISHRCSIVLEFTRKYDHVTPIWGCGNFISWDDLIIEEKGFVKDGKITVEAQFTISNIVGIRRIVPIDFTDRNDPRHDLILLIEGKYVYVGKQILAFHSPVFNAMFYGNHIEKNKRKIELKEIDHKVFIEMLNLIYPSYQKINDDNAESLLKMADYFQINAVIDQVEQFLIDSSKMNVLTKFKLSDQYRLVKLQDHCFDSFKTAKDIIDLNSEEEYKELSLLAKSALMDKTMKLSRTS